jgi:hypothetical protein
MDRYRPARVGFQGFEPKKYPTSSVSRHYFTQANHITVGTSRGPPANMFAILSNCAQA